MQYAVLTILHLCWPHADMLVCLTHKSAVALLPHNNTMTILETTFNKAVAHIGSSSVSTSNDVKLEVIVPVPLACFRPQ